MSRVESEPIRLTFVPSLIEQKRAAQAAFIAARDKADADLWAQIRADRAARQAREAGRWMETR